MDIRKTLIPNNSKGLPVAGEKPREYIFFKVQYNHFREVSGSTENAVLDREEMRECECALLLPENYSDTGAPTQLILACHGGWGRVCMEDNAVGATRQVGPCVDAGYAALDVCGSELHGTSLGCPEHIFALYKAYRYAITHYNLTEKVLVYGGSMGGQTVMNFANMFPNLVIAAGLFFPSLNLEGYTVDGHHVIGQWDRTTPHGEYPCIRDLVRQVYRFPDEAWNEERTAGFNPYHSRSFVDSEGQRVVFPPCPIKIWQGTEDKSVDPVGTLEYVRSVRRGGSYIELRMLEGVGHTATPVMREEIKMWFDRFI